MEGPGGLAKGAGTGAGASIGAIVGAAKGASIGAGASVGATVGAAIGDTDLDLLGIRSEMLGAGSGCWTCWNKAAPDAEGSGGRLKDRRPAPGTESGPEQEIHDRFRGALRGDAQHSSGPWLMRRSSATACTISGPLLKFPSGPNNVRGNTFP
ncbi:g5488 [Coccomyxa viridis]|uniref:G5488 protein n=1 Tax=Coccomyxa viridis TaxID=1274662 RepID=A0ABP1FXV4_9CHLO